MARKTSNKLTDQMVGYLRDDYIRGIPLDELMENYAVSRRTVERIVNNQSRYSEHYAKLIGQPPKEQTVEEEQTVKDEQTVEEEQTVKDEQTVEVQPETGKPTEPPAEPERREEPRNQRHPGQIELNLSPKTVNAVRVAMRKVGLQDEPIGDFIAKTLVQACTEYARMPIKCTFGRIVRRSIRG